MTRKLVRICVISKHGSPSNHSHSKAIYRSICQVHTRKCPLNNFLIDQRVAHCLFSGRKFGNQNEIIRFAAHSQGFISDYLFSI